MSAGTVMAEGGWQPIETAPRDRTEIIGAFFRAPWADRHMNGRIVQCWFEPAFDAFISSAREMTLAPGYTFEDGSTSQMHSPVIENVSHWMPLPVHPGASNRERLERAEEERVAIAKQSTIPGMVTHQWQSEFYAAAIRDVNSQRKLR